MEQLYTIGQASKLKGVSPRMLRYYDQLGILVPKSVDAQTGYRRYTLDQMVEIDVIRMCVESGIPLAELAAIQERDPKQAPLNLLVEAQSRLAARIESLGRVKRSIDDYLAELADGRSMPRDGEGGSMPSGVAVALLWERSRFDAGTYLRAMTELEGVCRQRGLATFLRRGMAFDAVAGGVHVFIEVASAWGLGVGAGVTVLTLPEGPFQGAVIEAGDVAEAFGAGYLAATAAVEAAGRDASAPACVTLTERWGSGLGEGGCSVLVRSHERPLEVHGENWLSGSSKNRQID